MRPIITDPKMRQVVPAQPLRQWVLSLPYALRAPLAYDGDDHAECAGIDRGGGGRWHQESPDNSSGFQRSEPAFLGIGLTPSHAIAPIAGA